MTECNLSTCCVELYAPAGSAAACDILEVVSTSGHMHRSRTAQCISMSLHPMVGARTDVINGLSSQ